MKFAVNRLVMLFFLAFVLVNAVDVITTLIGFQLGAVEGDEETKRLMNLVGVVEALLLKFFLVISLGSVAVVAHGYSTLDPRLFVVAFGIGVIFYLPILFNNLSIILNLLGVF